MKQNKCEFFNNYTYYNYNNEIIHLTPLDISAIDLMIDNNNI